MRPQPLETVGDAADALAAEYRRILEAARRSGWPARIAVGALVLAAKVAVALERRGWRYRGLR